jgi:hypothetical protein
VTQKRLPFGDICIKEWDSHDFDEERRNSEEGAYVLIVLGVVVLVGIGALGVLALRYTFVQRKIRAAQKQAFPDPPQT